MTIFSTRLALTKNNLLKTENIEQGILKIKVRSLGMIYLGERLLTSEI